MIFAIGCDLGFDDRVIVGLFLGLGVIVGVHHVQVEASRENHGFVIGRNRCPAWFPLWFGIFVEQRQFAAGQIVFKAERLRCRFGISASSCGTTASALLRFVVGILIGFFVFAGSGRFCRGNVGVL